jgi:quercetin 2,3-dioxygenase
MKTREIKLIRKSQPTMEGAGVKLNRAFGYYDTPLFDPFLLLDDFRSNNPDDYIKGFPWHPHRGIETITYLIKGSVEHADSLGNKGVIASGDVQWMTAGSGIIHQEMPKVSADGKISGFQLWANLPASHKMMKPRYQDIKSADIPEIMTADNCKIRVVCGSFEGTKGPVTDIITNPVFFDITIPSGTEFSLPTSFTDKVFCYVVDGDGYFCEKIQDESVLQKHHAANQNVVLFTPGDRLVAHTKENSMRFLFLLGKPLNEPIAWHGPIVMNTEAEIELALNEYRSGTFIK